MEKKLAEDQSNWPETLGESVALAANGNETHKTPSKQEIEKAKQEHPDLIFTNEEYKELRDHELAKAGLWEVPDYTTDKEVKEYFKKCSDIVTPIYQRRYKGYDILPVGEMPEWDISMTLS